jgi:hypothetical protein
MGCGDFLKTDGTTNSAAVGSKGVIFRNKRFDFLVGTLGTCLGLFLKGSILRGMVAMSPFSSVLGSAEGESLGDMLILGMGGVKSSLLATVGV